MTVGFGDLYPQGSMEYMLASIEVLFFKKSDSDTISILRMTPRIPGNKLHRMHQVHSIVTRL
uniref:Ion_trans_2 domain-containing protein n=1 Tax=Heterorhabditis bacteriophora TaxID=37862 RepID=A0A1I7WFQ1_HETBA